MSEDLRKRLDLHAVPFLACLNRCSRDQIWQSAEHWQIFDDAKTPHGGHLARHWAQGLAGAALQLDRLNQAGAGVFLTVNRTNGEGRTKAHIRELRGWHVDLDRKGAAAPFVLVDLSLPPTMAVATPGGWHLYWLAHDPMSCTGEARWLEQEAELRGIQATLARYGADPKACTVERVLRVPGFYHRKGEPCLVELVTVDGPRYSREAIREAFPPLHREQARADVKQTGNNHWPGLPHGSDVLERAGRYLDTLPPAIQGENGSGATFRVALKLLDGFALSEDEAVFLLWERYNPRCLPPWTLGELRHKVQDAAPKCRNRGWMLGNAGGRVPRFGSAR